MKNFFKKLSFVLAIAMVLTSLTPAVASAASKNFVTLKGDSKTAVTSIYAWIGGVSRNLDYNIGGKTSGVKGTWKSNNEKVVKVNKSTGVLTPVANGTTTVTFTPSNGKNAVKTTVKVRTRAAALHIYDKAEYKAGEKNVPLETVTAPAVELKVGESMDLKVTMPLSKKQQAAGAKIASYFTYAEYDEAIVTVEKDTENGNERAYTLTAKAPGEATVTIVANQTTQQNVRNGKYYREAKISVKVVDAFSAKQTGANKITVTGTDLTDKVEDYVVKRSASVTNIKEVIVNDTKTEAVLEATATNLTAGTYTLAFKGGEAYEFPVEAAVVANIEILSDVAVLDPVLTTKATATYKVTNQFGEDVTANSTLAGTDKLTINGTNAERTANGKVTFTSTQDYRVNVDIVALTIVCNTNGVNAQKTLTVSNKAVLDSVEYVGVYKMNNSGVYEEIELKEKTSQKDMNDNRYYVLFSAKDQYGSAYETISKDQNELNVVISGVPGVMATDKSLEIIEVKNVKYIGVRLASAYQALNAGTCDVLAVATMSGKTTKGSFNVVPVSKVDSISIATSEVYAGVENELEFEVLDTDGNLVTNYNVLAASGVFSDIKLGAEQGTIRLERKSDGNAKLVYIAPKNLGTETVVSFTIMSETHKVCLVRLTLRKDPVPTKITAIKGVSNNGNLGVISGKSIKIDVKDLTVVDQYGNPYKAGAAGVSITAIGTGTKQDSSYFTVSGSALTSGVAGVSGTAVTSLLTITGKAIGASDTIMLKLVGKDESACTVKITCTEMSSVTSNVQIEVPELMYHGTKKDVTVKAMINGSTVELEQDQYNVVGADNASPRAITAPTFPVGTKEGEVGTFTVTVTVNGTDYTKEVKYSNATRSAVSAARPLINPPVLNATTGTITFENLVALVEVKDQYGDTNKIEANHGILRAKVDIVAKANDSKITVDTTKNNSSNVTIANSSEGDIIEVTYDLGNGKTSIVRFTLGPKAN